MSAPRFQRGDIVFVRTPHADDRGASAHPALVVGDPTENSHGDYVLIQITKTKWMGRTDYFLADTDVEFSASGLEHSSTFRCHKLFVLSETMVQRKFGTAGPETMKQVAAKLKIALGL